ncbi:MAG: hypothetical protein ACRETX_09655, partial [Steroidobacteraceae bacterium]
LPSCLRFVKGYPSGCVETGQPGGCDPTCPGTAIERIPAFCHKTVMPTYSRMPGCRRPDGTCGAYYDLGIGCALPDLSDAGTDASDAEEARRASDAASDAAGDASDAANTD